MADEIAQSPSLPIHYSTNYGEARSCVDKNGKKIGNCRATPFHPGVDLTPEPTWRAQNKLTAASAAKYPPAKEGEDAGAEGWPVYAPFDGWILYSGPVDKSPDANIRAWLDGYGPGAVVLAHDELGDLTALDFFYKGVQLGADPRSGHYTLLAHIDPVFAIELDGATRKLQRARGGTGKADPKEWAQNVPNAQGTLSDVMTFEPGGPGKVLAFAGGRYVQKGTLLGTMRADMGHTHWEVRTTPFASPGPKERGQDGPNVTAQQQRIDPWGWLNHYVDITRNVPPVQTAVEIPSTTPPKRDDGGWFLALAIGFGLYELTK